MQLHTKNQFAVLSVLTGMGIILGYFENVFMPVAMLPGIKFGISNVVVLFILIKFSRRSAFVCGVVKSAVTGVFSGGTGIIYSLSGIVAALALMNLVLGKYKKNKVSETGLSIMGSSGFAIGQILASCIMLSSFAPVYYLPVLLCFSVLSGAVTGVICGVLVKRLDNI